MKREYFINVVLFALILSIVGAASWKVYPVEAEGEQALKIAFSDLGFNDETFQGVYSVRDYAITLPVNWNFETPVTLVLNLKYSPVLHPSSSLAVDWNEVRVNSTLFNDDLAELNGQLAIEIPQELIHPGDNSLKIQFYLGMEKENFCKDKNNPAMWATIYRTSYLQANITSSDTKFFLKNFPQPFLDPSPLVQNDIAFVLPDQPNLAELNALATISARFGQLAGNANLTMRTLSQTQYNEISTTSGDLIIIGKIERIQKLLPSLPFISQKGNLYSLNDTKGQPIPSEAGILWEQVSPFNPNSALLVITGLDDQAIIKAGQALTTTNIYPHFSGTLGVVLEAPKATISKPVVNQEVPLKSLGYSDTIYRSGTNKSTTVYLSLPFGWDITTDATFEMDFSHSEMLQERTSSISVTFNDIPVASVPLNQKNASAGHSSILIPARLFQSGSNKLTITPNIKFDANGEDPNACIPADNNDTWVVVSSSSYFSLPGSPTSVNINLNGYPYAFMGASDLSNVAFVVPTTPDISIARAITSISASFGKSTQSDILFPHVVDEAGLENLKSDDIYQVLVGAPMQNSGISNINNFLPVPFKPGTNELQKSVEGITISASETSTGYLQVTLNQKNQLCLVVTGNDNQGIEWAAQILSDPSSLDRLDGNFVVVQTAESFVAYNIRNFLAAQEYTPRVSSSDNYSANRLPVWATISVVAIFLGSFSLLILAWLKGRSLSKKKDEHETLSI